MTLITEDIRAKATEIHHGNDKCKAQFQRLVKEVGLPNGLLPLEDILEAGYVEETGFVWMKRKKETKHKFEKVGRVVSYAAEVTAYVEPCKIRKLTGVKARELMVWFTVAEISVDSLESEKIVFKTSTGLFRTFPTNVFMIEGTGPTVPVKDNAKEKENVGGVEVANLVKEV